MKSRELDPSCRLGLSAGIDGKCCKLEQNGFDRISNSHCALSYHDLYDLKLQAESAVNLLS